MAGVGKFSDVRSESDFEWRIDNLPSKQLEIRSPSFSFAGAMWCIDVMYSLNDGIEDHQGELYIILVRITKDPLISLECVCGVKNSEGKIVGKKNSIGILGDIYRNSLNHIFKDTEISSIAGVSSISGAELLEKNFKMVPNDVFTVFCTLQCPKSEGIARYQNLPDDLERMMKNVDYSDTTIKVKGEEFHLHRNILKARNPFFNAMFESEMRESITIDDCESHIFRLFIRFIYTGEVYGLSLENLCDVSKLADKYQADQLKEECLLFMKNFLSVDSFCDIVAMILNYNELELLEIAKKFFAYNYKEIISSPRWISFMKEHTVLANEMMTRALNVLAQP